MERKRAAALKKRDDVARWMALNPVQRMAEQRARDAAMEKKKRDSKLAEKRRLLERKMFGNTNLFPHRNAGSNGPDESEDSDQEEPEDVDLVQLEIDIERAESAYIAVKVLRDAQDKLRVSYLYTIGTIGNYVAIIKFYLGSSPCDRQEGRQHGQLHWWAAPHGWRPANETSPGNAQPWQREHDVPKAVRDTA